MNRKKAAATCLCFVFSIFCFVMPVRAQEADLVNLIQALQKQMTELQSTVQAQNAEIQDLKKRGAQIQMGAGATSPEAPVAAPMSEEEFKQRLTDATGGADKWLKGLKFKGDARLRYEAFQNTSGNPAENDDRNRFRYRLRYGFEKKFSDQMNVGFALASGEAPFINGATGGTSQALNGDPTSTNQSFDSNFNFKPIYIEKIFATYLPEWAKVGPIAAFNITAGKMDNLFEKGSSDLVWDRDVKPEGIIEKVDLNLLDTSNFDLKGYATAGQFVLDEDGSTTNFGDANLFAYQLGLNPVFYTGLMDRPVDLLSAMSFYQWGDFARGNNWRIEGATGRSLARGNPVNPLDATELAAGRFNVWEFYNELSLYPYGIPVRPFVDWVVNTGSEADSLPVVGSDDDRAWAYGLKIGGIKKKGDWEAGWAYKHIGANATPGFNDSDFGFAGHSGLRGNQFKAGYALTDYLTLNGAAFFVNNLNTGTGGIRDEEQRRFQMDMTWKF